jgi:hypothetical protein
MNPIIDQFTKMSSHGLICYLRLASSIWQRLSDKSDLFEDSSSSINSSTRFFPCSGYLNNEHVRYFHMLLCSSHSRVELPAKTLSQLEHLLLFGHLHYLGEWMHSGSND